MEFCELGDLSYFIKKRDTLSKHPTTADMIRKYPNPAAGGLNEVIVRHFLKQLASALEFLRARNFIHRDVKPQNLLLDPSPQYYRTVKPEHIPYAAHDRSLAPAVGIESLPTLKIADFGFARSLPSTSLAETLCGSPLYMAPEILRYEKYDAKADLWSVGTVLYEMISGKPPFRASNHVELLRKIERGEDKIRFPDEVCLSDSMKKLIRGLLKRNPVERMGFQEFFNNMVVKDEIPGLVEEDKPVQLPRPDLASRSERTKIGSHRGSEAGQKLDTGGSPQLYPRQPLSESPTADNLRGQASAPRHTAAIPSRTPPPGDRKGKRQSVDTYRDEEKEAKITARRPSMTSHATAPARQDLYTQAAKQIGGSEGQRQPSKGALSGSPSSHDRLLQRERVREAREAQERAAQEVAFERDYVLVDKRNVEVNAFADELAASPRIYNTNQTHNTSHRGALVRRATTQGAPASITGAQASPSKAIQAAGAKRPDHAHNRQASYERRFREGPSATSAISKAINMASGRLFNLGFSPPLGSGRAGQSPPSYNPFPTYPVSSGSILMLQDGSKAPVPLDEDTRAVQAIEESATRSNVVYGFAEIKFQQLIPVAPSMDTGLGLQTEESKTEPTSSEEVDLNIGATVMCAEEALVLYVKALSLLARSMNIAGAWWARKNRGDLSHDSGSSATPAKPHATASVGNRVNNVVQWVRGRFNEVLEKAEFVRLKLVEAQRQLPAEHPSHPNNYNQASGSATTGSAASGDVTVTSGVTAEKLMYDYALEKSRSAAVNELVGDNLPGCEIDYITAIWLLEAILEDDDELPAFKKDPTMTSREAEAPDAERDRVNGVEAEDRKVVLKREFTASRLTRWILTLLQLSTASAPVTLLCKRRSRSCHDVRACQNRSPLRLRDHPVLHRLL